MDPRPVIPLSMAQKKSPRDAQAWIDARKRHRLSHAQVQMARELGLNPRKLGKIDNHKQEPWKAPLPEWIEEIYRRRFKRDAPLQVWPLEDRPRAAAPRNPGKPVPQPPRPADAAPDLRLPLDDGEEVP